MKILFAAIGARRKRDAMRRRPLLVLLCLPGLARASGPGLGALGAVVFIAVLLLAGGWIATRMLVRPYFAVDAGSSRMQPFAPLVGIVWALCTFPLWMMSMGNENAPVELWMSALLLLATAPLVIGWSAVQSKLGPIRTFAFLQRAVALAWLVVLPAWLAWADTTHHHRPVAPQRNDVTLAQLRPLVESEAGSRLVADTPSPGTCDLRVLRPGAARHESLVLASFGSELESLRDPFPDAARWQQRSATLMGVRTGELAVDMEATIAPGAYAPVRRFWFDWQVVVDRFKPAEYWPLWAARRLAENRLAELSGSPSGSTTLTVGQGSPNRDDPADMQARMAELRRVIDAPLPGPSPHRLRVRTRAELACDAPADTCRRFDALLGDTDPVVLEERCSDPFTARRESMFRIPFFKW